MKSILLICLLSAPIILCAQFVGIGTKTPVDKLNVDSGVIRIGKNVWTADKTHWLKFGDDDYVKIGENGDDTMLIHAKNIKLAATQAFYAGITKVDLNGTLAIKDGTQAVGKVLTCTNATDGSAAWQTLTIPTGSGNGFSAYAASDINFTGSAEFQVNLTTEEYDDGNNYASASYTAPSAGVYHFDVNIEVFFNTALASSALFSVSLNSTSPINSYDNINRLPAGTTSYHTFTFTRNIKMSAGEKLTLFVSNAAGTAYSITGARSYFSGYKVY